MKKVDFNKLQAGDLVQVPRTQFAPMRSGWTGWRVSEAVVMSRRQLPPRVPLVQWLEQPHHKRQVVGSSPTRHIA